MFRGFKNFLMRGDVIVVACPACLSEDLPAAATKCRYCGTEQPPIADTSPRSG